MDVTVLRKTEDPERLVCQAARGDYHDGYVGDTEYAELMDPIDYDDQHVEDEIVERHIETLGGNSLDDIQNPAARRQVELAAKTRSFIEQQLARGHYGPWEHPQITFSVKGVSRVTMAQITRHRHMTFDIQSMRYVDFSEKDVVVPASLLSREERIEEYPHVFEDSDGKHFSREDGSLQIEEADRDALRGEYETTVNNLVEKYRAMVDAGVPKEDARFILPLGTPVNMTFSGNARTFLHLLDMRKKANAQWEIRELSERLLDELFDWMPYTFSQYEEHGPNRLSP